MNTIHNYLQVQVRQPLEEHWDSRREWACCQGVRRAAEVIPREIQDCGAERKEE